MGYRMQLCGKVVECGSHTSDSMLVKYDVDLPNTQCYWNVCLLLIARAKQKRHAINFKRMQVYHSNSNLTIVQDQHHLDK